jgi:hypothetical protein
LSPTVMRSIFVYHLAKSIKLCTISIFPRPSSFYQMSVQQIYGVIQRTWKNIQFHISYLICSKKTYHTEQRKSK